MLDRVLSVKSDGEVKLDSRIHSLRVQNVEVRSNEMVSDFGSCESLSKEASALAERDLRHMPIRNCPIACSTARDPVVV